MILIDTFLATVVWGVALGLLSCPFFEGGLRCNARLR